MTVTAGDWTVATPPSRRTRHLARLSLALTAAMAVATTAGLVSESLYRDPPAVRETFRAYDLVTLVVVVPALAFSSTGPFRHMRWAPLVRDAALAYAVYDYAGYVFGAAFNDLFLLHVGILVGAAIGLGMTLASNETVLPFRPRPTRAKAAASLLGFLTVGLAGMWIYYSLRFAISGADPAESKLVLPVSSLHLAYVLDLVLLVPAYATASYLAWRQQPFGCRLALIVLLSGVVHQLSYMVALTFQYQAGIPGSTAYDPGEPLVVLVYLIAVALLVRRPPARP